MLSPWPSAVSTRLRGRLQKTSVGSRGTARGLMRGQHEQPGSLFSYVSIEERIPASHPLRRIRKLA
ncbi:MAG: hypothetical protein ACK4ZO_13945, partial [Cyanobacteriota bacterium]